MKSNLWKTFLDGSSFCSNLQFEEVVNHTGLHQVDAVLEKERNYLYMFLTILVKETVEGTKNSVNM